MNTPTDAECTEQAVASDILQSHIKTLDQLLHNMADIDDPRPGSIIAGRIEADHLGEPFKLGALLIMQVLEPDAQVSIGTLYILDDGDDVAVVRMQGQSADLWVVDQFTEAGDVHRRTLYRRRWQPRASIVVQ
jgi:hypothetical protein